MNDESGKSDASLSASVALNAAPAAVSRRALLRGATIAAPTILTLYSGAALAQSSNLIGAAPTATAENNRYNCLDTSSVYVTDKPNVYDLGEQPMAHVTTIQADGKYYTPTSGASTQVTAPQMCSNGGWYKRKNSTGGFTDVQVSRGVMISATALSSFSNVIKYTNV
jgi:hypothetical protein